MEYARNVKVVLFEPDRDLRGAIRGTMRDTGFSEIIDTDRPKLVSDALADNRVDLLVCDVNAADGNIARLVRDTRRRRLGNNPFPIVIGITANADQQHVSRVIDDGLDALTLKPLDLAKMSRRFEIFMHTRKPFVTTVNYIGPDRRQNPRYDAVSAPQLIVPNPVSLIAGGTPRDVLMAQIKDAAGELDERQMLSNVEGVVWDADKIARALAEQDHDTVRRCIRHLNEVAKDMDTRLERTVYAHVRELCDSLLTVAARLEQSSGEPESKDVELMCNLAQAIRRGCRATSSNVMIARQITESVTAHV